MVYVETPGTSLKPTKRNNLGSRVTDRVSSEVPCNRLQTEKFSFSFGIKSIKNRWRKEEVSSDLVDLIGGFERSKNSSA